MCFSACVLMVSSLASPPSHSPSQLIHHKSSSWNALSALFSSLLGVSKIKPQFSWALTHWLTQASTFSFITQPLPERNLRFQQKMSSLSPKYACLPSLSQTVLLGCNPLFFGILPSFRDLSHCVHFGFPEITPPFSEVPHTFKCIFSNCHIFGGLCF